MHHAYAREATEHGHGEYQEKYQGNTAKAITRIGLAEHNSTLLTLQQGAHEFFTKEEDCRRQ
jgi:hypothetical protein